MKFQYIPAIILSTALAIGSPGQLLAQDLPGTAAAATSDEEDDEACDSETEEEDDNDASVRENAVIDFGEINGDDIDIPVPSFIRQNQNHVIFNGADWSELRKAFQQAATRPVSIVHIGDSHVQADINTGMTRDLLQYDFGNAGRGMITPLKMSGTNQPSDYTFSSPDRWNAVKLMSRTWDRPMGFTGTSIHPAMQSCSITIGTSENDDYDPFSTVTLFHGGKITIDNVVNGHGEKVHFRSIPSRDYTQIVFASQETKVTISFTSKGDLTVYGASLGGGRPGIYYHAIGNNGATYATYNRIGNVGPSIAALQPELVIISLGTNEAFGRLDTSTFFSTIDRLVQNIRTSNPRAQILLVTPMECQRSAYKTVSKKVKTKARRTKKGKRRKAGYRTVNTKVKSYQRNANILPLRNEILRYGRENGVAVLDWYEVAGGAGASDVWINNGLFSKDRVHHSYKGYHLQGRLLYDALIDALKNNQ